MSATKSRIVGFSLLATAVLIGVPAPAMEPSQSGASTPSLPALSLPSFFDDKRLPDLQDAWRLRQSEPATPSPPPNDEASKAPGPAPTDEATLTAARAAMIRAEQAGREAAAVRQKAEELSRRFGNDSAPSAPAGSGELSTGAIEPSTATPANALGAPPPADPGGQTAATAPETSGLGDGSAKKPDEGPAPAVSTPNAATKVQDAVIEDDAPAGQRKRAGPPPVPVRSPKTAVSDAAPGGGGAVPLRSKPVPGSTSKADALPANMGAFGWDSQPE